MLPVFRTYCRLRCVTALRQFDGRCNLCSRSNGATSLISCRWVDCCAAGVGLGHGPEAGSCCHDAVPHQRCRECALEDYQREPVARNAYASPPLLIIICHLPRARWPMQSEAHRAAEAARIAKDGQVVDPQLYYTKQTIGNACGTIGMLHAIANASTLTGGPIAKDSWLDTFVTSTLASTPDQRAARLETDGGLEAEHAAVVQEGQSAVVEDTWQHFICFVVKGGHLYELDGRKDGPINHGPSSQDTLLQVRRRDM